ncbi:MAG: siderophore-interacting protein [Comamonas sp.]
MTRSNTPVDARRLPQRIRHELRFRRLSVLATRQPTPDMIRITVGGADLAGFASAGFDDHVKLFFPDEATGELRLPTAGPDGPVWPDGPRPVVRDYTPLAYDAEAGTLELAFALHEAGPATRWARQARPGDLLGVGGPRGSFVLPLAFDGYVLIGDDTALPAIERRLAELPEGAPVRVIAEVDGPAAQQTFASRAAVVWQWVHRNGQPAQDASRLLAAVASAEAAWPAGDVHVWIAGESTVSKALRAHFVGERGQPSAWIKASGYWRAGAAGAHDEHGD